MLVIHKLHLVIILAKVVRLKNKMTQDSIKDLPEDLNSIIHRFVYSTTEKRIGTWIDGKPLYRKTLISVGNTGDNVGLAHNIPTIGAVIRSDIFCTNNAGRTYPAHNDIFNLYVKTTDTTNVWCNISSGFVDIAWKVYLTIEYTKTTD